MNARRIIAGSVAVVATATAVGVSVVAGMERGTGIERPLWVSLGVVLTVGAHLIPALSGGRSKAFRTGGFALWLACMACAMYGHMTFFSLASEHAGAERASAIAVPVESGRGLTAIARERAASESRIARLFAIKCKGSECKALRASVATERAKLSALDVERTEVERQRGKVDAAQARRDEAATDPVARVLSGYGVTPANVTLFTSMALALTLELVACFMWSVALPATEAAASEARAVSPQDKRDAVKPVAPVKPVAAPIRPTSAPIRPVVPQAPIRAPRAASEWPAMLRDRMSRIAQQAAQVANRTTKPQGAT